jgi:hypothetical protein
MLQDTLALSHTGAAHSFPVCKETLATRTFYAPEDQILAPGRSDGPGHLRIIERIDRRAIRLTRYVDPKVLPQASSAFHCENIPSIAPHIAAYIRKIGMV